MGHTSGRSSSLFICNLQEGSVYAVFTEGAKEGFSTAIMIIPYLVAMLCAIGYVQSVRRYGLAVQSAAAADKLNQHAGRGAANGDYEILLRRRSRGHDG